jgi:hypothetical protein
MRVLWRCPILVGGAFGCSVYLLPGCTSAPPRRSDSPNTAESLLRLAVPSGDPRVLKGARYTVFVTDRDITRVLEEADFRFPPPYSREYRLATTGELQIRVIVKSDTPPVRGEGTVTFALRPDLYLSILVGAEAPSTEPMLYRCMGCTGRAAFPLYGDGPLKDSLVISWAEASRSRPNPPSE